MKLSSQPSPIQSHYYKTPGILCNDENFLGFQFAREEHNASFMYVYIYYSAHRLSIKLIIEKYCYLILRLCGSTYLIEIFGRKVGTVFPFNSIELDGKVLEIVDVL